MLSRVELAPSRDRSYEGHADHLAASVQLQLEDNRNTDVTIMCSNGDTATAHSCILACADSAPIGEFLKLKSRQFKKFIYPKSVWTVILNVLYTGEWDCPQPLLASVKEACFKLESQRLISMCTEAERKCNLIKEHEDTLRIRATLNANVRAQLSVSNYRYRCTVCQLLFVHRDAKLRHLRHAHNASIRRDPTPRLLTRPWSHDSAHPVIDDADSRDADTPTTTAALDTPPTGAAEEDEDGQIAPPTRFMQLIDVKNRVYLCTICDMTFVTGKNVLRHEESHVRGMIMKGEDVKNVYKPETPKYVNGKRIYSCDICDKRFPNGKNISRHKRTKHGVDVLGFPIPKNLPAEHPSTCPICSKVFTSRRNLRCHQSRVHKDEIYNNTFQKSILEGYDSSCEIPMDTLDTLNVQTNPMIFNTPSSSSVFPDQL